MTDDTKPESASEREWWIETQEIHEGTRPRFWPQVYETDAVPGTIRVIEKSAYDRQEKTISELRAMNTDKANELKRWVDKVLDLEKRLGVAESVGEIQGGFFDCLHPGCCCVCGHSGKCPECGPTAGLSETLARTEVK